MTDALPSTAVLSCRCVPVVRDLQPRLHRRCAVLESLIISLACRPGVLSRRAVQAWPVCPLQDE